MQTKVYFNTFSQKEKILLYIIPLMVIALYFIYKPNQQIPSINNDYTKAQTQLDIIKYFENLFNKNRLKLHSIVFTNNTINLKLTSSINNIVKFINQSNTKYEIISYKINQNNKKIDLDILFDINKIIHIKNKQISKYDLKNPFIKISKKNKKLSKAIIGQYVLIDNKWYKKGDKYNNKIISNIYRDKIEFNDKNNISVLKVFDEK